MYNFTMFMTFIAMLAFPAGILWLIVNLIRKKSKKKPLIVILASLVIFVLLCFASVEMFPEETEAARIRGEQRRIEKEQEEAAERALEEQKRQEEEAQKEAEEEKETEEERIRKEEEEKQAKEIQDEKENEDLPDETQTEEITQKEEEGKREQEDKTKGEEEKGKELSIEESEIYSGNGISIIAKEVEVDRNSTKFLFVISNSSEKDYSIAAHSYDVNGLMAGSNLMGFGSVDVPAGKNAKLSIEIGNEWIESNGISEIQKLNVIFWSYYDDFKEWDTGIVSVPTNLYKEENSYIPGEEEIYSDDAITVWKNKDLTFTVWNKSNYNCGYTIENCSVNEWSYELTEYTYDLYDEEIHSNSYAVFTIPIEDFLKDNDIEEVNGIEFDVLLEDSYWDYKGSPWEHKSGKISINTGREVEP